MASRTDWKAVWIGAGITLVAGCAVSISPSQLIAWAGLLTGAIITGIALGSHFGGMYVRLLSGVMSFVLVAVLFFLVPHPTVFEHSDAEHPPVAALAAPESLDGAIGFECGWSSLPERFREHEEIFQIKIMDPGVPQGLIGSIQGNEKTK
jgi:hypothetical protein